MSNLPLSLRVPDSNYCVQQRRAGRVSQPHSKAVPSSATPKVAEFSFTLQFPEEVEKVLQNKAMELK
ncbi:hypothetical protein AK830_g4098 [Neonectria ditissima]|uniref:Uncharacterized protein n=1 Tax=Neonectria ditissima TaxID=78410 RepID=A0A0P7BPI9_9HYPO|nr:hypothetical protein AK830_g4098 [Neonectria ditissima]